MRPTVKKRSQRGVPEVTRAKKSYTSTDVFKDTDNEEMDAFNRISDEMLLEEDLDEKGRSSNECESEVK